MKTFQAILRKYFVAGFLVLVPVGATFSLLRYIIGETDKLLTVSNGKFLWIIPAQYHPEALVGFHIPGLGIIITFLLIVGVGVVARNFLGRKLIQIGDQLIHRIPLIRGVYSTIKQILEKLLQAGGATFKRVALIEYPRRGIFTLVFVTGSTTHPGHPEKPERLVSVFVPTTPNPTSGFYMMLPEADVKLLNMSTERAFKIIISGGILNADDADDATANRSAPSPTT